MSAFQKGHPRYGGARKNGRSILARMIRRRTDEGEKLVNYAIEVFNDPAQPVQERMRAMQWLADRGWGQAKEIVEHDFNEPLVNVNLAMLSVGELRTLRELAVKVLEQGQAKLLPAGGDE